MQDLFDHIFPLYEFARTRDAAMHAASKAGRPMLNNLVHRTTLSTAENRVVTTPNNDTLYSSAWIDLSQGPVRIQLPANPDRYVSVALMDSYTDNFAILRPHGQPREVLLVGPRIAASRGRGTVRAPGNQVWLLARIVVNGAQDIAAAREVQQQIRLIAPPSPMKPAAVPLPATPTDSRQFLSAVRSIVESDARPRISHLLRSIDTIGTSLDGEWANFLPQAFAGLRGGLAHVGVVRNGWAYPPENIGRFGKDDTNRARVAMGGLGALPTDEAVYFTAVSDSDGKAITGLKSYSLKIPASVPLEPYGFWSVSMYEVMPDGRQFFVANALDRYAVSDRTPELARNADGSVTIVLSHKKPDELLNWLPAPPGQFSVTLRVYRPLQRKIKSGFLPPLVPRK